MSWSLSKVAKSMRDIMPMWSEGKAIRYWSFSNDTDLKCLNGKYHPPNMVRARSLRESKGRRILCKVTDRNCVCAVFIYSIQGDVLSDLCESCPGFEKRRSRMR